MKTKEDFFVEAGISNPDILSKEKLDNLFFRSRSPLAHKGDFGHCLLIAGSYGKAGACVLSAMASLRTGCGLISVHIPKRLYDILQISVPEAMISLDNEEFFFSNIPDVGKYSAIAIGPGLDTKTKSRTALVDFLEKRLKEKGMKDIPLVLDADALNILSQVEGFQDLLYDNIILTPHPKEFERLFGEKSLREKLSFIENFCRQHRICIVLKGGVTTIADTKGNLSFNTKGNPGMATAGSGDVLTGIILGVLSQGFSIDTGAKTGVYLHALAGDFAKEDLGEKTLLARDIINCLSKAIMQ